MGAVLGPTFSFSGELFEASAEASWVFVALPPDQAEEIRGVMPTRPGFGSIRVAVMLGASEWNTSIFPSKDINSYVLPVKRAVRDAERIDTGDVVDVTVHLLPEQRT